MAEVGIQVMAPAWTLSNVKNLCTQKKKCMKQSWEWRLQDDKSGIPFWDSNSNISFYFPTTRFCVMPAVALFLFSLKKCQETHRNICSFICKQFDTFLEEQLRKHDSTTMRQRCDSNKSSTFMFKPLKEFWLNHIMGQTWMIHKMTLYMETFLNEQNRAIKQISPLKYLYLVWKLKILSSIHFTFYLKLRHTVCLYSYDRISPGCFYIVVYIEYTQFYLLV